MSKNAVIELIRDAMGDGFESFCMCLKRVRPVHVQPRPDASGYNYDIAHHLDRLRAADGGEAHVVTQRDGFAATFKDVELLRETIDAVGVDVVRGWLVDCVPLGGSYVDPLVPQSTPLSLRAAELMSEIAEKQAELDKLRKLAEASNRPTRSGVAYVDNMRNLANWLELIEAEVGDYGIDDEGKTCLSSDDTRGIDEHSAQLIADLIESGELPWF